MQECCVRGLVSIAIDGGQHNLDSDEAFVMMCSSPTSSTSHVSSAGTPRALCVCVQCKLACCAVEVCFADKYRRGRDEYENVDSLEIVTAICSTHKLTVNVVSSQAELAGDRCLTARASVAEGPASGHRNYDCRRRRRHPCKRIILLSCPVNAPAHDLSNTR